MFGIILFAHFINYQINIMGNRAEIRSAVLHVINQITNKIDILSILTNANGIQ